MKVCLPYPEEDMDLAEQRSVVLSQSLRRPLKLALGTQRFLLHLDGHCGLWDAIVPGVGNLSGAKPEEPLVDKGSSQKEPDASMKPMLLSNPAILQRKQETIGSLREGSSNGERHLSHLGERGGEVWGMLLEDTVPATLQAYGIWAWVGAGLGCWIPGPKGSSKPEDSRMPE